MQAIESEVKDLIKSGVHLYDIYEHVDKYRAQSTWGKNKRRKHNSKLNAIVNPLIEPLREKMRDQLEKEAKKRALAIEARIKKLAESNVKLSELDEFTAHSIAEIRIADRRRLAFKHLRKMGFKRDFVSGKSAYYVRGNVTVRVSDHSVPMSAERNMALNEGGFTWAATNRSFVIDGETSKIDVLRWLVVMRNIIKFI